MKIISKNILNKEDILNDINIIYHEVGFINTKIYKELGKYSLYKVNKYFKTFNNALKELNLKTIESTISVSIVNKEDLINDIKKVYYQNEENFNRNIYLENGQYSEKELKEVFGTFTNMIKEVGLLKSQQINKNEAINAAKRLLFSEGDLTESLFFSKTDYSIIPFRTVFKTFSNFIKEAGLGQEIKEIRANKIKQSAKTRPSSNKYQFKNITKEELIEDILLHQSKCEGKFTSQYYYSNSQFTRGLITKHFGSFSKMLEELNLVINMNKDFTKEDVIQHMLELYKKHGKLTSSIQRDDGKYSQSVITKYFGSFENMKKELDIENGYNRNITSEDLLDDLLKIAKKHGEINSVLIDKEAKYSRPTYLYRLGGNLDSIVKQLNIAFVGTPTNVSNIAKYCLYLITELTQCDCEFEKKFDWLKTNKGTSMRIDGYFEQHKLAIEYDGEQHYIYNPYYDPKYENFIKRQERDKLKDQLCKENGITLIRIRYDEPLTTEFLKQKLIENGIIKAEN